MADDWNEEIKLEQRLEELAEKKEQPSWWAREGILATRFFVDEILERRADPIETFERMMRKLDVHASECAARKAGAAS